MPVVVLTLLLPPARIDLWQRFLGLPYAPAVFAGAIAALALIRRDVDARPIDEPGQAGSFYAVGLAGAVALATFGLPDWNTSPRDRPATELRASAHWELQFEKGGMPEADQASLLSAADLRIAAAAGRLGIAVPARRIPADAFGGPAGCAPRASVVDGLGLGRTGVRTVGQRDRPVCRG